MRIRCYAIDDEPLALELIKSYIEKTPFLEATGIYGSAIEALAAMKDQKPELIFLDIQMPSLSGLQLASVIDTFISKVVFITAFDNYALEGFKADALDYLLKPVSYEEFLKAAQKAYRYITGTSLDSKPMHPGFLMVRSNYKLHKINCDDIIYVEAIRDYVAIYTENSGKLMTLSSLKSIEASLPESLFVRVHRSFIVNINKVKTIERSAILFGRVSIPVSEIYRKSFMEHLKTNSTI